MRGAAAKPRPQLVIAVEEAESVKAELKLRPDPSISELGDGRS